jgi:hypothetical protein
MCYQIFNKGIKSADFLGFMSNLTHCLRAKKGVKGDYRRHNKSKPPQEQIKGLLGT